MDDVTRKVERVSRVKVQVASAGQPPQQFDLRNNVIKITDQWPLALIIFGGVLTLVWLALLIWIALRLLLAV
jgi:hypothetical protein